MSASETCETEPKRVFKDIVVKVITTGDSAQPFRNKWKRKGAWFWKNGDVETEQGFNHAITFILKDKADLGATFKNGADAAFGASSGNDCPPAGADGDGEIDFGNSSWSPDTLTIVNRNHAPCALKYSLFFDSSAGSLSYDPIIRNTGGGPL